MALNILESENVIRDRNCVVVTQQERGKNENKSVKKRGGLSMNTESVVWQDLLAEITSLFDTTVWFYWFVKTRTALFIILIDCPSLTC